MIITNSVLDDIPEIFRLYKFATDYQKITFPGNVWPEFDKDFIATEVMENRQFKIMIDGKIACIWAITYNDAQIWEESENNDAIYLHRIATNPDFRGNNFVQTIAEWSKEFAKKQNKKFVRMDTCGQNDRLINHYKNSGFQFLGMKKLKDSSELQEHYQNADVCYFEIKL
ncbi:GNAT family N-acetyltransferase [Chryseobacterium gotjawalense]|uniref:GNAT family N-acetyltransferase n=1 Tax=Chryseobacterium gotjawalense TaxID=3042315 RepID=A0ABY8RFW7_9FLAO|nr:GNAT family N-acetyltransferase [Chryseobacterium sp. wdc7]WHF52865.1 GNAT family N-acetyltransferase [Chryseobacterium sp. wdc7]